MTLSNLVVDEFKNYKIQFLTKSLLFVARPMIVPITASKSFDLEFFKPSLLKILFERKLIKNGEVIIHLLVNIKLKEILK